MEYIFKSENSLKRIQNIREFLLSDKWMLILSLVAAIFACLHSYHIKGDYQIWGTVVLAYITGFCFLMSGDIITMLIPTMFTYMIAMRCYDSLAKFLDIAWLFVPLVPVALFNLIAYRKKPTTKGSQFKPMLFVSVAVILGGVGFISPKEYFSGTSLYHMLGIGFAMLLIYCYFYAKIDVPKDYSLIEKITKIMVVMGLFASFMVIAHYMINIQKAIENQGLLYVRWRNNLSTILMIVMPFAFLMARNKSYATIFGFLFYFAMLITGSRGAMVFGTIEIVMCTVMFVLYDKRRRLAYGIICGCIVVAALMFLPQILTFFDYTIDRLFRVFNQFILGGGEDSETRVKHYARGIQDFLNQPIFGTGLGYMGNRDIFQNKAGSLCWYHCEPIQIAASFGVVGIVAFIYQFIKRNALIWKKATFFNMTIFLSYFSLEMMSLVNPGVLCPMPYLLLVTLFMVIVEKCNNEVQQERIPILKKFRNKLREKKNA